MSEKKNPTEAVPKEPIKAAPGDGIRSMKATYAFRAINFELYAKPSWVDELDIISQCNS